MNKLLKLAFWGFCQNVEKTVLHLDKMHRSSTKGLRGNKKRENGVVWL